MATPQSQSAIKEIVAKAERLESQNKRRALSSKYAMQEVVGYGVALVSAAGAGYADKALDLTVDETAGDGVRLAGIPVMPLVSLGMGVGGLAVGGKIGNAMKYSGLGIACGFAYHAGRSAE